MTINDKTLGRLEVYSVPLPGSPWDISGTYTPSGRVLVAERRADDSDLYRVYTLNDDGGEMRVIFEGDIPQKKTANGIRWMCFADNRRVLLGDYVLECEDSLDASGQAKLYPVRYPAALEHAPAVFRHWSEIIVSPDMEHIVWTMLTFTGADNFIGRLVRTPDEYVIEDVYCVSSRSMFRPDPENPGCVIPQTVRGGEVKQFIKGGAALSLVGNSDSLADSVIEELDTGAVRQFSDTPGYEETAIFSPDEELAICMSPRFSAKTNAALLGLIPLPHSGYARMPIINPAYQYAIGSERIFRRGLIGPALADTKRTLAEGRRYMGADLGDPENRFVYYSPMSWSPCGTKAMWNERTRLVDPARQARLRVVRLLDREPAAPVPAVPTPDGSAIPYAIPLDEFLKQGVVNAAPVVPFRIRGKASGEIVSFDSEDGWRTVRYDDYSDDGKTFWKGEIASKSPASMYDAGKNAFRAALTVRGEHNGRADFRVVFTQKSLRDPVMLSFAPASDGLPATHGFSEYDGVTVRAEDMEA